MICRAVIACFLLGTGLIPPASADEISWLPSTGGDFNTPANWSTTSIPGFNDTALFNIGMSGGVTLSADAAPGSITFDTNATSFSLGTLNGNSLTLSNGGAISIRSSLVSANQTFTINAPLILTPDSATTPGTFTIRNDAISSTSILNVSGTISSGVTTGMETLTLEGTNTGSNTIAGVVSDGGASALALKKTGAGTWILSGANTFTGGTTIEDGTLRLSGGDNRLLSTGTLAFAGSSGSFDVGSTTQTLGGMSFSNTGTATHVITGTTGTLLVTGGGIQIGGGDTSTSSVAQTVDMSGLGNFIYNNSGFSFNVGGTTNNASSAVTGNGTLFLAETNTITASSFNLSPYSTGLSSRNSGIVHLGQTNTINANNIVIGGQKTTALMDFQALTNPTLKIRGTGGTDSNRAAITVGSNNSGITAANSTLDLTSGGTVSSTLDALVSSLVIAQNVRNTNTAGQPVTGTFIMGLGTLDATSILLGGQDSTSLLTTASAAATGTLTLNGGTILTSSLTLADKRANAAATPQTITSHFNLNSGTLAATLIQRGGAGTGAGTNSASIHFNWVDGIISNLTGTNQTVSGNTAVNGLTGGLNIVLNNTGNISGTHTWNVSEAQVATVQDTVTLSGAGGLTKSGAGNLILNGSNSYSGVTRVSEGILQFGLRSSLYDGSTAAWTAGNLIVESGATAAFHIGGPGEFTLPDVELLVSLGTPSGGFTSGSSLGLDTSNAPGEILYGTSIQNPNGGINDIGLVKLGSGTLTLSETNTYTGNTRIDGGTLKLTGGNNQIPSSGTLNFSGSTGTLDVGATHQTLAGLTFDSTGTNDHVITGAGSLTVTGGNFQVGGGDSTSTSFSSSLDMSGLGSFTYNRSSGSFNIGGRSDSTNGSTVASGALTLASANVITASSFNVGFYTTGLSAHNTAAVHLGQTNEVNASTFLVSNQKTTSVLDFQNLVNPTLKIRGTAGTDSSRAAITVGTNSSGVRATNATMDLTSGGTVTSTLDAMVSTLLIGQVSRNGSPGFSSTGTFIMSQGTLDATSIILGQQTAVNGSNSSSNAIATLSLNGGNISTTSFTLADKLSGTAAQTITSTFNLNSGRLKATAIQRGTAGTGAGADSATIHFNWVDGTIGNIDGTDLTVSGNTAVNGLTGGLNIVLNNTGNLSGTHTLGVSGSQTAIFENTVIMSGPGSITKTGSGTLIYSGENTYIGLTTVEEGELQLNVTGGQALAGNLLIAGGTAKLLQSDQIDTSRDLVVSGGAFDVQSFGQTLSNVQLTGGSIIGSTGILTSANAFDLQAGTIRAILGGSSGVTKTSAGTVTLSGANIFAGGTTVSGGTLIAQSGSALGSNSGVNVSSGASFVYLPTSPGTLNLGSGIVTLADGSTLGASVGGTLSQSAILSTGIASTSGAITLDINRMSGSVTTGTHTLISTAGGLTTGGATYTPRYFNFTDLTPSGLSLTDTQISITLASAPALTTGYWKGGNSAGNNIWSVSNGVESNWVTNSNGTGTSAVVPGSGTSVIFSASGASQQSDMILGSDMSIRSLVVNDTNPVTLNADDHTLTITNAAGITLNSGSGAVTLNSPLILGASQSWTNNSTSLLMIGGEVTRGASTLTVNGTGNTTISGAISGTGTFTKNNAGTLTLSGNNTSTGPLVINAGTVNISNGLTSRISLGAASSTAVLNILPGADIQLSGTDGILPGSGAGSVVVINQSGGTVVSPGQMIFAQGGSGAYAFYNMTGGSLLEGDRFRVGGGTSNNTGIVYQSGGSITLTFPNGLEVGGNATGNYSNSQGVAYLTGGELTAISNRIGYNNTTTSGGGIRGEQTVAGTAQVTINGSTILGQAAGDTGILNLNGGTYSTRQIARGNASGTSILNLNGGTIQAATSANNSSFLTGLSKANVSSGGVTFDTNYQTITIGQALLAPTGNGVTTIPVTDGGSGYAGAPYLQISGGGGAGATAVANMIDDGTGRGTFKIGSITVTSAGTDYTGTPAIAVSGGGGTAPTLGAAITAANSSGGLTKTGNGNLILTGTNTYTGQTSINEGNLQLGNGGTGGSLSPSSTITLAAGTSLTVNRSNTATQGTDFASGITGAGTFVKSGTGTVVLGPGNSYTGSTSITAGKLSISSDSSLGSAPSGSVLDQLSISSGSTLVTTADFSITSTRGITIGSGGGSIETNPGTTVTVESSMVLSGGLTKTGAGTLLLNGNSTGSGPVAVTAGTLGGSGHLSGDTSVSTGATITAGTVGTASAPLAGDIGTLSFAGNLTTTTGTTWLIDLVQGVSGSADRIDVGNILDLSNASLSVNFGGTFEADKVYTIATYGSPLTGAFNGLNEGDFVGPGNLYFINYGNGTNGAITLTAVPEPGTFCFLGMAFGGYLIRRIRQKRPCGSN